MKVVTTKQMRRLERKADAEGLPFATMMENAGRAVAEAITRRMEVKGKKVLALIGPGNNGGDGLVAARHLHDAGAQVTLYIWKRQVEGDENFRLTQERGISTLWAEEDADLSRLREQVHRSHVLLDACLGTGIARPIKGLLREILGAVREAKPPSLFVVAVDVPSGLNCDTGAVDPATLPADLTVTFGFPKVGQFLFPGAGLVGELEVADIGIPAHLAKDIWLELATEEKVRGMLPARPLDAHKGTFGKVMVVAGSVNFVGAAYLASAAATRVGAGLVTLALARSIHPILASKLTEVTFLVLPEDLGVIAPDAVRLLNERLPEYNALLLGPGLTQEEAAVEFVRAFLRVGPRALRPRIGFVGEEEEEGGPPLPPMVIDADGLNTLAKTPGWWERLQGKAVLTPHPGEMSRLMGCTVAEVEKDRIGVARERAREWGQVVLLKGAYTLIASPQGQVVINPFANPGLASGGTGDVLAGAIAGFLAQGLAPFEAAVAGAYVHGLAGEMARRELGEAGMVASDLLPLLPRAIRKLKK